jgi:hypothetical protein
MTISVIGPPTSLTIGAEMEPSTKGATKPDITNELSNFGVAIEFSPFLILIDQQFGAAARLFGFRIMKKIHS